MYDFAVAIEQQQAPAERHDQQQCRDRRPELPLDERQIEAPEEPSNRHRQDHEANQPGHMAVGWRSLNPVRRRQNRMSGRNAQSNDPSRR